MGGTGSFDFAGQSAVVTGSTKGIGRGIATALAEADANVLINARTESDVEATVRELRTHGEGEIVGVSADVGVPSSLEALAEAAIERIGPIDLLVNNAAIWREANLLEASLEDWDQTMAVNVRSQFYLSQLLARHMVEEDISGNIVNVTSQTGDRRAGPRRMYGISKTAINGLTWRLAGDFAAYGIRVNAVSTDVTDSHQLRKEAKAIADREGKSLEEVLEEWGTARPLGRLGQPEDIADAVLFLASDRAEYVVGHILRVSGGGNLQ